MSGPVGAAKKASKNASKNAYRRAKKKAQRLVSRLIELELNPQISIIQLVHGVNSLAIPTHSNPHTVLTRIKDTPSETDESSCESSEPLTPDDSSAGDSRKIRASDLLEMGDMSNQYDLDDPIFEQYKSVFEKFKEPTAEEAAKQLEKPEIYYEADDIPDEEEENSKRISKKERKRQETLSVAELKGLVKKPELVEWTDVSSSDPVLLLALKGYKNAVPVPSHWNLKREYLSSKRGIEKPPFALPKFIAETGISEMRDAVLEKQADMTLKQKQRERVQGKLGKMDIDYSKLYDAFFRRQTKPELTKYGEVYYEGKEYETNLLHLRPGELSDEVREALGMAPGHPPPWLINQQRFGPPPTYPNLKVPGVNAPIPPGASWGYAPGQWGKPPQDDQGRPLFGGDLFGTNILEENQQSTQLGEPVERAPWGVLRPEDDEEEDDGDEEEEHEAAEDMSGVQTSMSGVTSAMPTEIGGTESIGGEFTLRKQRAGIATEEPGARRSAYQVLEQKEIQSTGFFGGEHAYNLDTARRDTFGNDSQRKRKAGDIDVSVDVDALEDGKLDKEALRKHYEAQKKAEAAGQYQSIDQDDLAAMLADESRKRQKMEEKRSRR
ncbi:DUF382-domain-containing protein [Corynespora cassiicola Philippines]|uniref:DUF382-domain-containing protein n=1 Tax=Corynespora cassiicola Philippines TaxID=1448308 RepID=A0A2T2NT70_CORCC|nr:DUF382-domain-containing protein [Corynespora cassiicola Philippines]